MPDLMLVLAVLVAALSIGAVLALTIGDRSAAPADRLTQVPQADAPAFRAAIRATTRRGVAAWSAAIVVLALTVVLGDAVALAGAGSAVFASPLIAGVGGISVYACLQARRLPLRAAGEAALVPRRVTTYVRTRSLVTMIAVTALLMALELFAVVATPAAALFTGPGALLLLLLTGVLVVITIVALRRIAIRAALPTALADADHTIRQIATRFVLVLSSSAQLATASLIALQSGGWLYNNAVIFTAYETSATVAGAVIAMVGLLAGTASLAGLVGALRATIKQARSARRTAARSTTAPA